MAKRKISASDLRKIRKNYKEDVKNESDSPVPSRKSQLKDAKLLGKMSKINDTGYTPKELKKQAREKLKDIKENPVEYIINVVFLLFLFFIFYVGMWIFYVEIS